VHIDMDSMNRVASSNFGTFSGVQRKLGERTVSGR
jgi:hypothetical protein